MSVQSDWIGDQKFFVINIYVTFDFMYIFLLYHNFSGLE